jgi:hypothetical protein
MDSALPTVYALRGKREKEREKKRKYSPNNTEKGVKKFQLMTLLVLYSILLRLHAFICVITYTYSKRASCLT